jgi:DNA-binding GntR family transcriptional regulator
MTIFAQIRAVTLREQVAEQIRTAIIEGQLRPNDHIVETVLTEQLGVSRTPVREALILLEREALVVTHPNRGCYVRAFNVEDVQAIFSMRVVLENFAAELIIDKLNADDYYRLRQLIDQQQFHIEQGDFKQVRSTDMAFHQYLINHSQHPVLMRTWQEIVAQIAAVLHVRADGYPNFDELQAIKDHQCILDAYQDHDLERLKAENHRINQRVQSECIQAIEAIRARGGKPKR